MFAANPTSSSSSGSSWISGLVRGRSVKTSAADDMASVAVGGDATGCSANKKNHLKGSMFKYGPNSVQVEKIY